MKVRQITSAFLLISLFATVSCDKSEVPLVNENNPLTDLPWLKAKVDEFILLSQSSPLRIAIYQCTYGNGETGFLEDLGNVAFFYNFAGETLCIMGGDAGATCPELNIVSQELIWKVEKTTKNDISACGINDPLQNIEWLRELCASLNSTQNFSSVSINLYRVINTDEHFFKIDISYSEDDSPFSYTVDWKNCIGDLIISLRSGMSLNPELEERYKEFLKNKEYVSELFHFVKQSK